MPKHEAGTPKDIAKRMKQKQLMKLKFYCQLCEKQCRDANGFKCHQTSESHLRQMKIFSENANGMMDKFSKEFEKEYLLTLRQRHTTKRVNANNVYQEVIQDKQHIHMNSTRWATLTDFVKYLGKTGKCVVDETERGWYVQYIENDASILARKEAQERRAQAEKTAEIAQAERMEKQRIEAAKALDRAGGTVHTEATKLERSEEDQTIKVALNANTNVAKKKRKNGAAKTAFFDDDEGKSDEAVGDSEKGDEQPQSTLPNLNNPLRTGSQKRSLDDDQTENSKRLKSKEDGHNSSKRKSFHKEEVADETDEPWLKRDIIVRIISKKLANGKYFTRKAVVDHVLKDNKYIAEVEVLDSGPDKHDGGDILRLDQSDLETVVPKEGKIAHILKGEYRGRKAKVVSLDKKKYRASLELVDDGTLLERVDFEDFSKLA